MLRIAERTPLRDAGRAVGTQSRVHHVLVLYPEPGLALASARDNLGPGPSRREVPDPAAGPAHEMVMGGNIAIVADEVTAVDLQRHTFLVEPVQVAIDGSQADPWKPLTDKAV